MITPDWQPSLAGALVELRPLAESDYDRLFAVASDREIWVQHPAHDRWQDAVFRRFFRDALDSRGALLVLDRQSGAIIGSSRYDGFDAGASQVEIGWTFLARSHWGGRFNHEMKRLMVDHAFRFVTRVIFLVGESNRRSRTALERIGATLTDERRRTTINDLEVTHVVYELRRPGAGRCP